MPETAASAMRVPTPSTKGRAANAPKRTRSDAVEPAPRKAVDKRAEQEADDDDRKEVRDEESSDPRAGLRRVVDLQRQRDGREVHPEARPRGGEEEVSERR